MIDQNESLNQLPNEMKSAFQELKIIKHLNGAGFKKKFGFTCAYLFRIVFVYRATVGVALTELLAGVNF